jgi:aspartate aminotransferase
MRQAFDARRRYMVSRLNQMPRLSCVLPEGAFYAYPVVSPLYGLKAGERSIADSTSLCEYLLDEARVACVPGIGFGTHEHIRLSYATSMDKIEAALDRIEAALARIE